MAQDEETGAERTAGERMAELVARKTAAGKAPGGPPGQHRSERSAAAAAKSKSRPGPEPRKR